ncbi:MAG: hypothetical protein AAF907_03650, partial [Planctomycetota bacterium]
MRPVFLSLVRPSRSAVVALAAIAAFTMALPEANAQFFGLTPDGGVPVKKSGGFFGLQPDVGV